MLRIRSTTGKMAEIQDQFRFVEVCDHKGDVAMLVYADDGGAVKLISAKDPEAQRYANIFKVKFCPVLPVKAPE